MAVRNVPRRSRNRFSGIVIGVDLDSFGGGRFNTVASLPLVSWLVGMREGNRSAAMNDARKGREASSSGRRGIFFRERAWMVEAVVMRERGYGEGTVGRNCDRDRWMASISGTAT